MFIRIKNKIQKECRYRKYRFKLKNKNFTLITQNCIGGVIYHQLGMNFLSPTINMFIEDENFIKLVYDLKKYMTIDPVPITDKYVDPIDNNIYYPKIKIDDIEICCLHYANCNDAISAWNRRRQRVNFDNVFVIGNTWNMHENLNLIEILARNPYKTVIFTINNLLCDNCIKLEGDYWQVDSRGMVRPNITDDIPGTSWKYFEKFFDFVKWLNE